jgi:hypothetical protein
MALTAAHVDCPVLRRLHLYMPTRGEYYCSTSGGAVSSWPRIVHTCAANRRALCGAGPLLAAHSPDPFPGKTEPTLDLLILVH